MDKTPLISVIVPIYNVEKYLDRCVESIVNQTYKNLEIILVDDGSPDNCGAICDSWAEKDSRIKVIHKENGGGAQARNVGIEIAKGDFIAFADSDDFLLPDMYSSLVDVLNKYACDIAECGYYQGESGIISDIDDKNNVIIYDTKQALCEHIKDKVCRQIVWNKVYKRTVIRDVRFVEGKFIDDEFFTYRVLGNAKKVAVISKKLYYYQQQSNSTMHQKFSVKRLDALDAKTDRVEYIEKNFPELLVLAKRNLWFSCIYSSQMLYRFCSYEEQSAGFKKIKDILKKHPIKINLNVSLSIKQRIWLLMAKISFKSTCKIRNKLGIGF